MKHLINLTICIAVCIAVTFEAYSQNDTPQLLQNNANAGTSLQNRINENNLRFNLPVDIKEKLDNFFNAMSQKEYKKGLSDLIGNSPVASKDVDYTEILKQIGKSIDLYGEIKGYEIFDYKAVGSSFFRIMIIGLNQKYPTRWEINFYRSPDLGLIVSNFKFDDISEIYLDR